MATLRKLEGYVQWKHVVAGAAFWIASLAGFGAWVISQADAQTRAFRSSTEAAIERIEQKVDRVLWLLLEQAPKKLDRIPIE